jgi:hypothetical protein
MKSSNSRQKLKHVIEGVHILLDGEENEYHLTYFTNF